MQSLGAKLRGEAVYSKSRTPLKPPVDLKSNTDHTKGVQSS